MTSTQTQIRRGTSGEVVANVPAAGEIWYNTTNKRLHVGDGSTYGGARIPNAADSQAGTYVYAAAGGTADAITISTETNPASLVSGIHVRVKIASSNTGAATLQWGSLSAEDIKKYVSGSKVALDAGDLAADRIYAFDYDGTDFILFQSEGTPVPDFFKNPVMIVEDQKTSGTNGGTFTSGAWRLRTLNTEVVNQISGASLSSNIITLPAGTFRIYAEAPAFSCDNHLAKLYNSTDASDIAFGTPEYVPASVGVSNRSFIFDELTLASTKGISIYHRCSNSRSSDGLGKASSFGTEIYTRVIIEQVA